MKRLCIVAALLVPTLALGKSVSFTPIGENILANSGSVKLKIIDVDEDNSRILIETSEYRAGSWEPGLSYSWDSNQGMVELSNENPVVAGADSIIYQLDSNSGFKIENLTEVIEVVLNDIPSDFYSDATINEFTDLVVTSTFGSGLTGWLVGSGGPISPSGFIWNKKTGFTNPRYNTPSCTSCSYRIHTGDEEGKIIAGEYRYNPMFINTNISEEMQVLEDFGYQYSKIIKLSDNGEYAIGKYYDERLQTETSLINTSDQSVSLFPKLVTDDFILGIKVWDSKMEDVTDNGEMAVGSAGGHAVVWTPESGLRKLADVAESLGADLEGWHLRKATHVSADGRYIFGEGEMADKQPRVWRLELIRMCETPAW